MEFAQKRLAEIACEIYAMTAVLSRTSYLVAKKGPGAAKKELSMAKAFFQDSQKKTKALLDQVDDNIDEALKLISKESCEAQHYDIPGPFDG
jgi:acyl-CoA dehydrogenase family protein 9